jgi:hypothetical protein
MLIVYGGCHGILVCWNYSYCGHVPGTLGITDFVRTESNTSVEAAYVRKTTYGRSYSAVWNA